MQVIQLLDRFCFGGGERVALTYQHTFNSLKINNAIIALDGGRIDQLARIQLVKNYWPYLIELLRQIRAMPSDTTCVIAHTNRALMVGLIVKLFFRKKIKLFYVQHLFYSSNKLRLLSIFQNAIERLIQITPITDSLLEQHFLPDKRFYLNNYLALESYESGTESNDALNAFLRFKGDRQVIAFLGRVTKGKNADHLLRLLRFLPSDKYVGLLLGTGEELEDVRRLAEEWKLTNVFIAGFQEQPLAFLTVSDYMFFCSSCDEEMMPMAVLEAKALGCKVIGYPFEINGHIIPPSNVVQYEDYNSIAQRILDGSIEYEDNVFNEEYGYSRFKVLFGL
jgi:glycosyltransferase involved in cell wall biosynthesis